MANNVQVRFSADIAELKLKATEASGLLKQVGRDWEATAKQINAGDNSAETLVKYKQLTEQYVSLTGEVNRFARAKRDLNAEDRTSNAAAEAFIARLKDEAAAATMTRQEFLALKAAQLGVTEQAAPLIASMQTTTGHMVSSRAATEGLVLVHEAIRGNYTRMTGSVMIMAQALAGQEMVTKAVTAATSPLGIAVIGVGAALAAVSLAELKYEAGQQALINSSAGLAAASGLTADQLHAAGAAAAQWSGASIAAASESATAFAAAGVRSQTVITALAGSVKAYATLTGQDAAEAQKTLATAMRDPERGAAELNAQLNILDQTQLDQIRTMTEAGDKTGAAAVITDALRRRMDEARASGAAVNSLWSSMTGDLSNLVDWLGRASDAMGDLINKYSAYNLITGGVDRDAAAQAARSRALQVEAQRKGASAAGGAAYDATPEGQDDARRKSLAGTVNTLRTALAADIAMRGEHSEAVAHDRQALAEYQRALETYLPAAEKAHRLAEIDAQIASARRGRDSGRVADLTRQKAAVETAGEVMSPDAAAQRANDAAGMGEARTPGAKKASSRVAEWTEQLREMEMASGDFYSDMTAKEVDFWKGIADKTKAGTKERFEVQSKIWDGEKALARQRYEAKIAEFRDEITAARDSWTKQQALYQEELRFIATTLPMGQQASQYHTAHKEMERAQQEHDARELAETERTLREEAQSLKKGLDDEAKVREEAARAQETKLKTNAGGSPFGDIKAEQQVAQIHAQLTAQKIADNELLHSTEIAKLDQALAAARATYGADETAYAGLIQAKKAEDQRYRDQKRALDAQATAQQVADQAALQAKYHSYIDRTVSTVVSGFAKMANGTMSLRQFGVSVFQSIAQQAEQQVAKMAEDWIVKHLLMGAASKLLGDNSAAAPAAGAAASVAASKVKVAALIGEAGAGGVASMAAAPFPFDLDAPAFGSAMAAAAGALGSFAQGTNLVPSDMVAQIHAGERIIPKADNQALMQMVARGAGQGDGGRGDVHLHYNPAVSGALPFADQLAAHESHILGIIQQAHRRGAFR